MAPNSPSAMYRGTSKPRCCTDVKWRALMVLFILAYAHGDDLHGPSYTVVSRNTFHDRAKMAACAVWHQAGMATPIEQCASGELNTTGRDGDGKRMSSDYSRIEDVLV